MRRICVMRLFKHHQRAVRGPFGTRMRYVYLKQADFIRPADVCKNDIHPAGAGIVTAEIDALADAKDNLRGTTMW